MVRVLHKEGEWQVICLLLKHICHWFFTISTEHVKPETRERLGTHQQAVIDILDQAARQPLST